MRKQELINRISSHFAVISSKIELSGTQNLQDINIFSEYFICDLLNLIYGINLENLNNEEQNSAAIDLGDYKLKQSYQVTSTRTYKKIKKTVDGFVNSKRCDDFDELFIFILTTKTPKFQKDTYTKDGFVFNLKTNIISFESLLSNLMGEKSELLQSVLSYLDTELLDYREDDIAENEMATIVSLINYLSVNRKKKVITSVEDMTIVDPNNKINTRFKEYAESLKDSYLQLLSVYGDLITTAEKVIGIDDVEEILIKEYLKDLSVEVLEANEGNPNKSLEYLTENFQNSLKKVGKKHDKMAIKFYLLTQTINCNVFPIYEEPVYGRSVTGE